MNHNLFFLFFSANLIFASDFTFDKESGKAIPKHVGEIKIHKGEVFVLNNSGEFPLKEGARFFPNDVIKTSDKSFAKIQMVDDSIYTIGSNSEFRIDQFKYVDKTNRKSVMTLIRGQIRGLIKNKANEGDLSVKTKLASMGVRGTEFLVNHQKLNNLNISEFGLIEGVVDVSDQSNQSHALYKTDRIVIVEDSNTNQLVKDHMKLSENELNRLSDEEAFMDFFDFKNINDKSPISSLFKAESQKNNSQMIPKESETKANTWQSNLKKLNQKLREYRN